MLHPTTQLDPFNCNNLPAPYNEICQAQKVNMPKTAPGSCLRLPPQYQAFCKALPPSDPNFCTGAAQDYNPKRWPNTVSLNPDQFARRREMCSKGPQSARTFYNCLWKPEQPYVNNPMVNTAHIQCPKNCCYPSQKDSAMMGDWKQTYPEYPNNYTRHEIWKTRIGN